MVRFFQIFRKKLKTGGNASLKAEFYIIGLGNPGKKYEHTRHNAGFDVVSILAERYGIKINTQKFKALCGGGIIAGKKAVLMMPQTYMNESGRSVRDIKDFYKIHAQKIIVVYDDADLMLSQIRIRAKGSAGSHKGMRSVIYQIGTEDFIRVRVGIGQPKHEGDIVNHVLSSYLEDEYKTAYEAYEKAAKAVVAIVEKGVEAAQALYN